MPVSPVAGLATAAGQAQGVTGPMGPYLPWPHLAAPYVPGTEPGGGQAGVFPGGGLASSACNATSGLPIQQACPKEIDLPLAW